MTNDPRHNRKTNYAYQLLDSGNSMTIKFNNRKAIVHCMEQPYEQRHYYANAG